MVNINSVFERRIESIYKNAKGSKGIVKAYAKAEEYLVKMYKEYKITGKTQRELHLFNLGIKYKKLSKWWYKAV